MIDCFALLNEARRPWIDPELLKQKFLTLSAEAHPDRVHNASEPEKRAAQQRYTELNADQKLLVKQLNLDMPPQPPPRISAPGKPARAATRAM